MNMPSGKSYMVAHTDKQNIAAHRKGNPALKTREDLVEGDLIIYPF